MFILDIIFIIIAIAVVVRCVLRGFIEEFLSMAALICSLAGVVFLTVPLGKVLEKQFNLSVWGYLIAALSIFLAIYLLIKILENIIQKIFDKLNLEKLDKALGFLLGLLEAFLVIAVLILILSFFSGLSFIKQLLTDSFIVGFLKPILLPIIQNQAMLNLDLSRLNIYISDFIIPEINKLIAF